MATSCGPPEDAALSSSSATLTTSVNSKLQSKKDSLDYRPVNKASHVAAPPPLHKSSSGWLGFSPTALRYISLAVLCLQNSVLVILVRLARTGHHHRFNAATAVLMAEFFKMAGCIFVLSMQGDQHIVSSENTKKRDADHRQPSKPLTSWSVIFDHKELLRVSVPAGLYVVQNNLQYVAVSNLDPATFQVLYQLKILTTAIFSVVMLRKSVLPLQWVSLCVLTFGIALVQLDGQKMASSHQRKQAAAEYGAKNAGEMNMTLGLFAVLGVCVSSGFAGVYFEKILKKTNSKATLWERNVQMGITSIVFAIAGLWWNDREFLRTFGFFYGYRPIVWIAIATGAFGGLMTAVVVKYADNILKGFATSLAIVLSVILSVFLFDTIPSFQFLIGALLVNSSAYVYTKAPAWCQELHTVAPPGATKGSSVRRISTDHCDHQPLTPTVASSPPTAPINLQETDSCEEPCSPRHRRPPAVGV